MMMQPCELKSRYPDIWQKAVTAHNRKESAVHVVKALMESEGVSHELAKRIYVAVCDGITLEEHQARILEPLEGAFGFCEDPDESFRS